MSWQLILSQCLINVNFNHVLKLKINADPWIQSWLFQLKNRQKCEITVTDLHLFFASLYHNLSKLSLGGRLQVPHILFNVLEASAKVEKLAQGCYISTTSFTG